MPFSLNSTQARLTTPAISSAHASGRAVPSNAWPMTAPSTARAGRRTGGDDPSSRPGSRVVDLDARSITVVPPRAVPAQWPGTADPGLFGPDSVSWRVHGDPLMAVGGLRALLDGNFNDRVFLVSFLSNVVVAALIVFLGDQLGVGTQLSTAVVVVLGIRIFSNAAAIRRHLFKA